MTTQNDFGPGGWTPERLRSLAGKSYVITGANAGAGFEASRILLAKGAKVTMLNRSEEKSSKAIQSLKEELGSNIDVSFIRMDLGDLSSVREAATELLNTTEAIDALICNAAIAQVAKQEFTNDGFESHLGVNHYGHFLLMGLTFDRIEESNGRIVVVGSEGYKMGLRTIQFEDMNWDNNYHANNTYCHSKLAQIMIAYELQERIKAANKTTKVYVCHPGASKTSLINEKASGFSRVMFKVMAMSPLVQSAEKGAYPEIMCATEDELDQSAYYGPSGWNNWIGPVGECELKPFAKDRSVAQQLWSLSEKETDLNWRIQ